MRRTVIQLLIIAVLTTNMAWAGDSCFATLAGDTAVLMQVGIGQDSSACDDLCVGWLHLHSITPETGHTDFPSARQTVAWMDIPFASRNQEPPLRPPQI
ncbi:MAG TPA: hypothetical protein ENK04_09375 [Gammaproteobacteria bacterium]|nr:hypothetical protein [Gammaproteobacteria bacterium]